MLNELLEQTIKLADDEKVSVDARLAQYKQIFDSLLEHSAGQEPLIFTTQFAYIDFAATKYDLNNKSRYLLQKFRLLKFDELNVNHLDLAEYALKTLFEINGLSPPFDHRVTTVFKKHKIGKDQQINSFIAVEKVFALEILPDKHMISARTLSEPFEDRLVFYDRTDRNVDLAEQLKEVHNNNILPLYLQLLNIEVDQEGHYHPSMIVLEPDHLYDVTSVSECFGAFINQHLGYLVRKFKKREMSQAILIGNTANFFFDELIYHPDTAFNDIVKRIFKIDPLSYCLIDDEMLRTLINLLEAQFNNIKNALISLHKSIDLRSNNAYIEPSFYSAIYGIQGRLDMLSIGEDAATIVELKSGKPYKSNSFGLNNNHYHQTLLYDLLIESAFGKKLKRQNYILYSGIEENNVRYAPAIKAEQREAIKMRNNMFILDKKIESSDNIIDIIKDLKNYFGENIKGYLLNDVNQFIETFDQLDELSLAYCNELFRFVYSEMFIAKTGSPISEISGLSSLWTFDINEKIKNYSIINHLMIDHTCLEKDSEIIHLNRTEHTAALSNFRVGDITVFYPELDQEASILYNQVFKCGIVSMTAQYVSIRLRSRQENLSIFEQHQYWHLEHDVLDNGFQSMLSSVCEFARTTPYKRRLILGLQEPAFSTSEIVHKIEIDPLLTAEQAEIIHNILCARDYYILWGPPGTGKTSVLLKELARIYHQYSEKRILLLAYTNRAVDEICDAIMDIITSPAFIRIGSRFSTSEHLRPYLLEKQIEDIHTRAELRQHILGHRIFVGTLASILGKDNLFKLVDFDLCIIDEASQILDASLIGILSRVRKFVLIGDHRQLPAVVQQHPKKSQTRNPLLLDAGISNFSNSLFERLYLNALKQEWRHAIGLLSYQGRMHRQILNFSNQFWYDNKLNILPTITRLTADRPTFYPSNGEEAILSQRMLFYHTPTDVSGFTSKINLHEARTIVNIVRMIIAHMRPDSFNESSIGIIAPYRAQIAAIIAEMARADIKHKDMITVDTVERYQGGARDVIILSCAMNYSFQLKSLTAISSEGLDRKLNVAITRAREQFILVGNKNILQQSYFYDQLIKSSYELSEHEV